MRRTLLIVLATLTAVAVGGCSSSSKSSSSGGATSPTTAKAAAAAGSSGGSLAYCSDVNPTNLSNLSQSFAASAQALQNPSTLQNNLTQLKRYVSEAPSAIQGDLNTFVTYYGKFLQVLAKDKNNPAALGTDMQSLSGDQQQLAAAGKHIEAYYQQHCHP
jgi:hypothetical protein